MAAKNRNLAILGILATMLVVAILSVLIFRNINSDKNPSIPEEISKKTSLVIFYPSEKSVLRVDKNSIKYDEKNKLISYGAITNEGVKIIFSQQPTPESFVDVPSAFSNLIEKLQAYKNFESANGKVSLTKPKELNGEQSAVMNSKGTLMFVRPEQKLTDEQWQKIFNNLSQIK